MVNKSLKKIVYSGLMIALVFVATFSIRIPVPFTQGYIHAGDSMIFISAILLGSDVGFIAGGIGSAMADIAGGYAIWALPTLIIKSIMGGLVGIFGRKSDKKKTKLQITVTSIIIAVIWFIFISILRKLVSATIINNGTELLSKVDIVSTIDELRALGDKIQGQLLFVSFIIPLAIVILSIFLSKVDKKLFGIDQLLGMMISGIWMVFGYYIAAGVIYGNFIVPIFSIPWNIIQFVIGLVIAYIIILALKNTPIAKQKW